MKTKGNFEKLPIDSIQLDMQNPRIVRFLENYTDEALTGEAVALALGGSMNPEDGVTGYYNLKESIRASHGIIHPIIVNYDSNSKTYVVIEGNTRTQIYKELREEYPGEEELWNAIPAMVYTDLPKDDIEMIRLQAHLVGPREWDPYSKAKYLYQLSVVDKMPISQLMSFCGNKSSRVVTQIKAYQDMEESYRPALDSDDDFNTKDYSKYEEYQKVKNSVYQHGYTTEDFTKWLLDDKFRMAIHVRFLPKVLDSKEAMKVFLADGNDIEKAYDLVKDPAAKKKNLDQASFKEICDELARRINEMGLGSVEKIKNEDEATRLAVAELKANVEWFSSYIEKEDD